MNELSLRRSLGRFLCIFVLFVLSVLLPTARKQVAVDKEGERSRYIAAGGSPDDFEADYPAIRAALMAQRMAESGEIAKRRLASLEPALDLLGLEITIPSTKAGSMDHLAFQPRVMERLAERVAALEAKSAAEARLRKPPSPPLRPRMAPGKRPAHKLDYT
jgi:hypothetical protein